MQTKYRNLKYIGLATLSFVFLTGSSVFAQTNNNSNVQHNYKIQFNLVVEKAPEKLDITVYCRLNPQQITNPDGSSSRKRGEYQHTGTKRVLIKGDGKQGKRIVKPITIKVSAPHKLVDYSCSILEAPMKYFQRKKDGTPVDIDLTATQLNANWKTFFDAGKSRVVAQGRF